MKRAKIVRPYKASGIELWRINFQLNGVRARRQGYASEKEAIMVADKIREEILNENYKTEKYHGQNRAVININMFEYCENCHHLTDGVGYKKVKACNECGEEKVANDKHFAKNKGCRDGLLSTCRTCKADKALKYRQENSEKIAKKNAAYYAHLPAGIYKITNKKNGKIYIGCTTALPHRWSGHKSSLKHKKHMNPDLQEDHDKYGSDVFEFKALEQHPCDTPSEVLQKIEQETIKRFLAEGKKLYNILLTNNGTI